MSDETSSLDPLHSVIKAAGSRQRQRRRRPWYHKLVKRFKFIYIGYMLVPIVLIGVFLTVLAVDSFNKVEQSQDDLVNTFSSMSEKAATELTLQDYEHLDGALQALNTSLLGASQQTRPLRLLSFSSPNNAARFKLLDAAIHATTGSRHFLAGLKPTVVLLDGGNAGSDPTGERSVELLEAGRSRFLQAQQEMRLARTTLDAIALEGVSRNVLLDIQTLRDYLDEIEAYNELALASPTLVSNILGLEQTQTYLILAQNSDEIRPSGGYISTWGWMQVRSSDIKEYEYSATTSESPNPPPASLVSLLDIPEWWFQFEKPIYTAWDGSWFADYPATAEMAAWYYDNGSNPHAPVDGVISVDLIAVEYLIRALGPISVPEYGASVDATNFRQVAYEIRANADPQLDHKQFVAALYKQMILAWQNADAVQKSNINKALLQALREKHIMLYFADEELQQSIEELGWGGAQAPAGTHDYLMIADANIGSKSSRSVQRQTTYDVTIDPSNTVNSRVSVLYNFSSRIAELDPAVRPEHYADINYFSLTQVFTPLGSTYTSSNNMRDLVAASDENHAIFAGLVNVPYDEALRVQLQYSTPNILDEVGGYQRYRLLLQKQPGTQSDAVTVSITLPPGSQVVVVEPAPSATYELGSPVLEFSLTLDTDTWIEIIYN